MTPTTHSKKETCLVASAVPTSDSPAVLPVPAFDSLTIDEADLSILMAFFDEQENAKLTPTMHSKDIFCPASTVPTSNSPVLIPIPASDSPRLDEADLSIIAVLDDQENAKSVTTMPSKEDIFPASAVPTSDSPDVIPSVPSVSFKGRKNHAARPMLFLDKVDDLTKTTKIN
ncbi:hypothetical protein OUZ56_025422 [Daphnia magna]|uniref:Uncharacterized protein n=1 Tax=Daphnia magna TaxID=35525 RepID=A0ABQ9ZJU0_9CRUS|nr:hypothetical protein OUZ56_025422 [Daphnia magna]